MKLPSSEAIAAGVFGALLFATVVLLRYETPVDHVATLLEGNMLIAAFSFIALLVLGTVIAPVAVLPIVGIASPVFGPFLTALLSIVGWTVGAMIAFLIARYAGRPALGRFVSLQAIERYESLIPPQGHFVFLVLLRMILPVDVLSYALGLLSRVTFLRYTCATALGVSYFSFVFAYIGEALYRGDTTFIVLLGLPSLALLLSGWYYVSLHLRGRG